MNLSGSNNKHPLNLKDYQIKVIQGESRGFKPRVQRKHKLPVCICVKNRGTSSSLQILHPTTFCFKEEGILIAHPPSCHPRRVFDCPENRKENERKGSKREKKWES